MINACGDDKLDEAKGLIEERVDVELRNGYTPLMRATRYNHVDIVQLLLDHGANINSFDIDYLDHGENVNNKNDDC